MSDAPRDQGATGDDGDLRQIDRALLTAIGRRQGRGEPLTLNDEQLLDDWVAGRLTPADADRAAALAGRNDLAAERVLERRLLEASRTSPGVPADVTAKILKLGAAPERRVAQPVTSTSVWAWLTSLGGSQWSVAGAVAAAAILFAAIGIPALKDRWQSAPQQQAQLPVQPPAQPAPAAQPERRIQLAMVTIDDRAPLSGRSSTRELRRPPEGGFRDVEIPVAVLRGVVPGAGQSGRSSTASQLAPYWPALAEPSGEPVQVLVDAAMNNMLDGDWKDRERAPVRIFDLNHPGSVLVRRALNLPAGTGPLLLLTPTPP